MRTKTKNKNSSKGTAQRTRSSAIKSRELANPNRQRIAKTTVASRAIDGLHTLVFEPKPAYSVNQYIEDGCPDYNKMATDLEICYRKFCRVNGAKPNTFEGTGAQRAKAIYWKMEALIANKEPKRRVYLNIESDRSTGRFYFMAYWSVTNGMEIYCFPLEVIKALEKRRPYMVTTVTRFFSTLLYKTGFSDINNNIAMDFVLEQMPELISEMQDHHGDLDELYQHERDLIPYLKGGDAQKYLKMFQLNQGLSFDLKSLRARHPEMKALKNWMIEGEKLMQSPDLIDVESFNYQPESMGDYGVEFCDLVPASRFHCIVWSVNDFVWQKYEEWLNDDAGNSGAQEPICYHRIDHRQNKVLKINTWYLEFAKWYGSGIDIIHDIIKGKK